jgi:hypothetical protein
MYSLLHVHCIARISFVVSLPSSLSVLHLVVLFCTTHKLQLCAREAGINIIKRVLHTRFSIGQKKCTLRKSTKSGTRRVRQSPIDSRLSYLLLNQSDFSPHHHLSCHLFRLSKPYFPTQLSGTDFSKSLKPTWKFLQQDPLFEKSIQEP